MVAVPGRRLAQPAHIQGGCGSAVGLRGWRWPGRCRRSPRWLRELSLRARSYPHRLLAPAPRSSSHSTNCSSHCTTSFLLQYCFVLADFFAFNSFALLSPSSASILPGTVPLLFYLWLEHGSSRNPLIYEQRLFLKDVVSLNCHFLYLVLAAPVVTKVASRVKYMILLGFVCL